MKRQRLFLLFLPAGFSFLIADNAYAGMCALCRRTLEMTGNQGLIKGFLWSILLIGGMPLLLAGFAVVSVIRGKKKAEKLMREDLYVKN